MRISDWSSDVCSSDLEHDQGARAALGAGGTGGGAQGGVAYRAERRARLDRGVEALPDGDGRVRRAALTRQGQCPGSCRSGFSRSCKTIAIGQERSEEHTSELQSLMRISYAVFCLKKKKTRKNKELYT